MNSVWDNFLAMFSSPLKETNGKKGSAEEGVLQKERNTEKGRRRKMIRFKRMGSKRPLEIIERSTPTKETEEEWSQQYDDENVNDGDSKKATMENNYVAVRWFTQAKKPIEIALSPNGRGEH
mmetsp:Transcript_14293/g.31218  ORF Transcript_14293/g.31218 Transcript_14293/m.31218 type:complete len:122 (+) Transcript_14293:1132-1497(+)